VLVGEDVDFESELETLHEGLEREQRAAEALGAWGAVAPWLRAPACAAVSPEPKLAVGIEAHDQKPPACAQLALNTQYLDSMKARLTPDRYQQLFGQLGSSWYCVRH
jgi:hypothetical protein